MVKLIVPRVHCARFTRCFSAKSKPVLNDTAFDSSNDEIKYRHHPGIIKPKTPEFPNWALKEIQIILKEKQIKSKEIKESAKNLICHLNGRLLPLEQSKLSAKLQKVEERLNANNNGEKISIKDIDFSKNRIARNILKQNVYNWQPITFDKLTCLTYLVGRSVQNYTVLYKILNEIKVRDKDFRPKTLFDFGSGTGTVMWAASEIWPDSLKEYLCVDVSESMIELSERLAKAATPKIKNIFYRQYFPMSVNPHDIVVSAHSLFELPNVNTRLETILDLWKKTENYLIIVEQGTNAGFKLVNEARDFILKYVNSKNRRDTQFAHVFAPCPHDLKCPRFATDDTPCNFSVLYHPLRIMDNSNHKSELYSYVVLKKSKRPEDDEQWPRIVRSVLNRSQHTICRMCVASGELKEDIFTKYKNGKHIYRTARCSEWGDRLPLRYDQQQESLGNDTINVETTNETTTVE
ncbi:ribosome assembly protein METTL17, mitochondrial [Linepithema humile]|uniref:ribosome assembly protein METTL17, mitochondrial n=1 Tax=Linepithema humile TaxID=83485 RepID=UPI0006231D76|nr:PREDICTED: methyltransferase-like protein 17, mitochondrial [Linepithema humile]XP_012222132.1 PREDICTED: methyltransferase-like protein 17, mitochondrial [Linepithema humile]XP_012222133.1 PREDICTED: methyltransferase-like protein 17, mitochondrial [Linepithema humile]XP_012222134.1 PREDICTED: methyltransferase-like protein 17, mitochondrial [Linepithema humile]